LVELFEDDVRFGDDLLAIDEGRHHGAAVEFEVPGLLVLCRAQHEVAAFPIASSRRGPPSPSAHRATCRCDRAPASFPSRFTSIIQLSGNGVHSTCSMRAA